VRTPERAASDPTASAEAVFAHVLVGIDDTPESLVAAAQAGVLRAPGGRLVLVAVAERYLAAHAGLAAVTAEEHVAQQTTDDLEQARRLVDADESTFRSGRLVPVLCAECERRGGSLIAVGGRPHRLLSARVLRGHDVEALQQAGCSLLVARSGWGPHRPDRIVVAVDGSPAARSAEQSARSLAARLGCDVVPVVGLEDAAGPDILEAERSDAVVEPGRLVEAVADVVTSASLVVVGVDTDPGRRRGGERLAERVLFGVRCSVLVARAAAPAA
jgi:nucleotide-binding universal stress UspA family protein